MPKFIKEFIQEFLKKFLDESLVKFSEAYNKSLEKFLGDTLYRIIRENRVSVRVVTVYFVDWLLATFRFFFDNLIRTALRNKAATLIQT